MSDRIRIDFIRCVRSSCCHRITGMDATPGHVPDELMQQLHDASERFARERQARDEVVEGNDFRHQERVDAATENLRKAEREVEEIEQRIRQFLGRPS